jgi:O-methyltransferase
VSGSPGDLYLDLLSRALLGNLARERQSAQPRDDGSVEIVPLRHPIVRQHGQDWPVSAETMIGEIRLANVRECLEAVLRDGVPGDLIEAGVWRGGACVFMRGILAAHGASDRRVWVADSFAGLPEPDESAFPVDAGNRLHEQQYLAVSEDEVRETFERYGLLDDQVRFLPGWFRDTLPAIGDERFAVVRLDGDMYESTMVALEHLYPLLSVGGYLIVDDYGALPICKQAVDDYRERHGIGEPIAKVDWTGAYWRKEQPGPERPASVSSSRAADSRSG